MEDENAEIPNSAHKISKREFLKLSGAAVVGAAAGYVAWSLGIKPETGVSPETELKPSVRVLDFFDIDQAKGKYFQNNFPPTFSGKNSWEAMGVSNPSTREGLLKAVPKDENQAKLLMMALFQYQYQNHGEDFRLSDSRPKNCFSN